MGKPKPNLAIVAAGASVAAAIFSISVAVMAYKSLAVSMETKREAENAVGNVERKMAAESARLSRSITSVGKDLDKLKRAVIYTNDLVGELRDIKIEDFKEMQKTVAKNVTKMIALYEEIGKLRKELSEMRKGRNSDSERIAETEERLKILEKRVAEAEKKIGTAEDNTGRLSRSLKTAQEKLALLQSAVATDDGAGKKRIEELRREIEELKKKLAASEVSLPFYYAGESVIDDTKNGIIVAKKSGKSYTIDENSIISSRWKVKRIFPDRLIVYDTRLKKDITLKRFDGKARNLVK